MNFGGTVHINRSAFIGISCTIILLFFLYRHGSTENFFSSDLSQQKYVNVRELLSASIDAAKRGGVKVYEVRKSADIAEKSKGKTLEGAKDPVTNGDIFSHFEMVHSLKATFPTINIISEEKPHDENSKPIRPARRDLEEVSSHKTLVQLVKTEDIQIWVDPLDATHEYTENLLEYVTTMVCVAHKGDPIIGVIHKPFSNFTAWAWVDHISSPGLEVASIPLSENDPIRIIVSRTHKGAVEEVSKKAFGDKVTITSAAGAGYKSLEVLSGHQHVYVHTSKIKLWDICAGNAILNHFGGSMSTLKGKIFQYGTGVDPANYDGVVATLYNHDFYLDKLKTLELS